MSRPFQRCLGGARSALLGLLSVPLSAASDVIPLPLLSYDPGIVTSASTAAAQARIDAGLPVRLAPGSSGGILTIRSGTRLFGGDVALAKVCATTVSGAAIVRSGGDLTCAPGSTLRQTLLHGIGFGRLNLAGVCDSNLLVSVDRMPMRFSFTGGADRFNDTRLCWTVNQGGIPWATGDGRKWMVLIEGKPSDRGNAFFGMNSLTPGSPGGISDAGSLRISGGIVLPVVGMDWERYTGSGLSLTQAAMSDATIGTDIGSASRAQLFTYSGNWGSDGTPLRIAADVTLFTGLMIGDANQRCLAIVDPSASASASYVAMAYPSVMELPSGRSGTAAHAVEICHFSSNNTTVAAPSRLATVDGVELAGSWPTPVNDQVLHSVVPDPALPTWSDPTWDPVPPPATSDPLVPDESPALQARLDAARDAYASTGVRQIVEIEPGDHHLDQTLVLWPGGVTLVGWGANRSRLLMRDPAKPILVHAWDGWGGPDQFGDGVTTRFDFAQLPYANPFENAIYRDGVRTVTGYTVSNDGTGHARITFATAPASGERLRASRIHNSYLGLVDLGLHGGSYAFDHVQPGYQLASAWISGVHFHGQSQAAIHVSGAYAIDNIRIDRCVFTGAGFAAFHHEAASTGGYLGTSNTDDLCYIDKLMFWRCQFVGNARAIHTRVGRASGGQYFYECRFAGNTQGIAPGDPSIHRSGFGWNNASFVRCQFAGNGGAVAMNFSYQTNFIDCAIDTGSTGNAWCEGLGIFEGCTITGTVPLFGNQAAYITPTGINANLYRWRFASLFNCALSAPLGSWKNGLAVNSRWPGSSARIVTCTDGVVSVRDPTDSDAAPRSAVCVGRDQVYRPDPPRFLSASGSVTATWATPLRWRIGLDGPTLINGATGFSATGLPSGLVLDAATGVIGGTPAAPGSVTVVNDVVITASNPAGSATCVVALTVPPTPLPVITSALVATGQVGSAFGFTITASNSPTGFAASGLPAGLSLDPVSGVISGIPVAAGATSVTLTVSNTIGDTLATITIQITDAGGGGGGGASSAGGGGGGCGNGLPIAAAFLLIGWRRRHG